MGNLIDAVVSAAARHGGRLALWAKGERLTYDELLGLASRAAAVLLDAGVRPGDRIAILAERSVAAYVGIVAALRAGCVYVPLNRRYPHERNRAMLEAAQASALLGDRASASQIAELCRDKPPDLRLVALLDGSIRLPDKTPSIDARDILSARPLTTSPPRAPDDDCYLLFTSGTTGRPKGVPISHGNVLAYLAGISELLAISAEDRLTQLPDLTFDLSGHDMFVAWTQGASVFSIPENHTLFAPRFVLEHELTGWLSVPSAVGQARKAGLLEAGLLPSLRFSVFCGEALVGVVADAWAAAAPNADLYNLYGPTEATIAISAYRYQPGRHEETAVIPLGHALKDQRLEVFGPDDRPVAPGQLGELLLAGSQITRGYWNAPEQDAQRFTVIDGTRWYRTGDLARWTEADGFHYVGRMDQQVKVHGFRVELLEIERALRTASGRDLVAVIAWPVTIDGGAEGTVAFVAGVALEEDAVLDRLRASLPDYMIPARFVYLDELPVNVNGKTDYRALEQHASRGVPPAP